MTQRLIKKLLFAYILLLPFNSLPFTAWLNGALRINCTAQFSDYFFLLILAFSIPIFLKERRVLLGDALVRVTIVILCYLAVNAALSMYVRQSVIKLAGKIYLFGIPVIMPLCFREVKDIEKGIKYFFYTTFMIGLLGVAAVILYYFNIPTPMNAFTGDIPADMHVPRLYVFFVSPDMLSIFLVSGIILSFYALRRGILSKGFFISCLMLSLTTLFFTFSRNIWALFVGAGVLLFYRNMLFSQGGRFIKIFSAFMYGGYCLILFIMVFTFTAFYIFPVQLYDGQNGQPAVTRGCTIGGDSFCKEMNWIDTKWVGLNLKVHNRMMEARDSWKAFLAHPVKGTGVGFSAAHGYFDVTVRRDAHNTYLTILSQLGIVGAILALIFLFVAARRVKSCRLPDPDDQREFIRCMAALFFVFAACSIFTDLDDFRYAYLFIGFINAYYHAGKRGQLNNLSR